MTNVETISRDTRSYRQGLVLGLTMAEVFLLLVFALLIALAALWNSERNKRIEAEAKNPASSVLTAADKRLLSNVKVVISAAGADKVSKTLDHLREGSALEPVSQAEKEFITEVRQQQKSAPANKISDQWRNLARAAQQPPDRLSDRLTVGTAVEKSFPNLKDTSRIIELIGHGIASEKKGDHNWPPIINLSEARGYSFEIGKAELTVDFEARLRTSVVPQLQERAQQYGATIIEVIGHTDEQKIAARASNLDWFLLDIINNVGKVSALIPADNAGLGLARAAAVVRILRRDERMKNYTVLPLSGGQLINVTDQVTRGEGGDDKERRRIEIRLRRPHPADARSTDASQSNHGR